MQHLMQNIVEDECMHEDLEMTVAMQFFCETCNKNLMLEISTRKAQRWKELTKYGN